jgi:hypothetical protein
LLVCPAWWVSHLERDWNQPAFHDFFATLEQHRTVVRYDRPGVGLSNRDRHDFTQETEFEFFNIIEVNSRKLVRSCPGAVTFGGAKRDI